MGFGINSMWYGLLGFGAPGVGLFASFYTRIRELFWIFVGVGLVKIGNKNVMTQSKNQHT